MATKRAQFADPLSSSLTAYTALHRGLGQNLGLRGIKESSHRATKFENQRPRPSFNVERLSTFLQIRITTVYRSPRWSNGTLLPAVRRGHGRQASIREATSPDGESVEIKA